jgi:hypothetical protein
MQFTDDEIETIKALIEDRGFEYSLTSDDDKVWALGVKLGIREPILPPTEEELKRREEFKNSPLGLKISEILNQSNEKLKKLNEQYKSGFDFTSGITWGTKTISPGFKFNF